ncbi:mitochondrial solute carrier family 25 (mitochondrial carnitine/acylcarnitine transporter) member 20/29 [Andalucia godoyi]|uniref:Mitochondrial solute carrier family 25 (Mitochondrial carnitine/acylcarnitine transporter) member 20/29 n=1 Tax=Andalucia godoyi TaxID=505711 RepID=A0A8K0AH34_ANDGO|nr:mitochondrial solute carrier family 25 (mitochondrial carnitine/acylcarnitine transporter) member 20/29 [Andalucia godoyi]|eukprot:ANDGO_05884.mRNA.1 mitochondrial solute carrier family 25 (mitochondrial carnitine/acylcarnitine transporter) member 20/29
MTGGEGGKVYQQFVAGTFGGAGLVIAGYPMDTIKVRLQTTVAAPAGGGGGLSAPVFRGPMDCLVRTVRHEGFRGLYKGVSSPLGGVPWMYTISFGSWGAAQKMLEKPGEKNLSLFRVSLAGAISGVATTVVTTPVELLKIRLQTQYSAGTIGDVANYKPKYNGLLDCAVKSYREHGIRKGLFRGFNSVLLRDVPGSFFYFGAYVYAKRALVPVCGVQSESELPMWAQLFAGGFGGVAAWATCLPLDAIKTRIQHDTEGKYKGVMDAFGQAIKEGGVKGLYRGVGPIFLRAFIADAVCFFCYEVAMKVLKKVDP